MENRQAPLSMVIVDTSKTKPCNNSQKHQKGLSGSSQCLIKDLKKSSTGRKEKKRHTKSLAELTKVATIVGPGATSANGTGFVPGVDCALQTYAHFGSSSNFGGIPDELKLVKQPRQKLPFRRNPALIKKPAVVEAPDPDSIKKPAVFKEPDPELIKRPAVVKEPEVVLVSDDKPAVVKETDLELIKKPEVLKDPDVVVVSDDSENESATENEGAVDFGTKLTQMKEFDLNMLPPGWDDSWWS